MAAGSDNVFPKLILIEGTTPASPSAGDQKLFIDSADHKLKRVNSSGIVNSVEGGAITQLNKQVLVAAAASISLPSIPATYNTLRLVLTGRLDEAVTDDWVNMQFNGDTAANYNYQKLAAEGTVVAAAATTAATSGRLGDMTAASGTANYPSTFIVDIPWYAGTTFFKQYQSDSFMDNGAAQAIFQFSGTWKSTAAITSIVLLPNAGNFIIGTSVVLYGLN